MNAQMTYLEQCRQRREEIARAVHSRPGDSYEAIGAQYGISRQRVAQIARQHGVRRRRDGRQ